MTKSLNNNIIILEELVLNVNEKYYILIIYNKFIFMLMIKKTYWRPVKY